jgi:hypothetical protein
LDENSQFFYRTLILHPKVHSQNCEKKIEIATNRIGKVLSGPKEELRQMPTTPLSWLSFVVVILLAYSVGRMCARARSEAIETAAHGLGLVVMLFIAIIPTLWTDGFWLRLIEAMAVYCAAVNLPPHPHRQLLRALNQKSA